MSNFAKRVYSVLKKCPKGRITTYKILAEKLGTKAYRAVGTVMNKNPSAPKVPCHRVVNSDGRIGGFAHGVEKKIARLKDENVFVENGKIIDFAEKIWR